jgi:ketosteroid isomerase-like protein
VLRDEVAGHRVRRACRHWQVLGFSANGLTPPALQTYGRSTRTGGDPHMSHETTLRTMYDAMNNKDTATIKDLIAEDATFHMLPNPVIPAATISGRDEIMAFMEEHIPGLDMQQEIQQISVQDDFATVYVTSQSKGPDGAPLTVKWADVFQFDGDRIKGHVSLSS